MQKHGSGSLVSPASEGLIWVFIFKTVTDLTETHTHHLGFSSAAFSHIGPTPPTPPSSTSLTSSLLLLSPQKQKKVDVLFINP